MGDLVAGIQTGIELQDNFTSVIYGIMESVQAACSQMENLQGVMNSSVDSSAWESLESEINQTTATAEAMNSTVDNTEEIINQNTQSQEEFNQQLQNATQHTNGLQGSLKKVGAAIFGMAAIKKTVGFIDECTEAFDTQQRAERQLMTVLVNTLDADYVTKFALDVDATQAEDSIASIENGTDMEISASVKKEALLAEFDAITQKAAEIQSKGIYGDEIMIAGAAELSTYFTDTGAVEKMMDTLSNYAAGMSGGVELDDKAMVDYATGLGKVMTGSYDAMTKKGFEFTDAQKAIIEGTAEEQQIVATLGEEYLNMSSDMQAAAAISQVIDESWAGMYENMSNTPQGAIIQMKNTWGDIKEKIGEQLCPAVLKFVNTITSNWPTINKIVDGFTKTLTFVMGILGWLVDGAFNLAEVIINNWSMIEPIVAGIVIGLGLYTAALIAHNVIQGISNISKTIATVQEYNHAKAILANSAAYSKSTIKTAEATVAQASFNTTLLASPVTWFAIMLLVIVAVLFAVCNWIAKTTDGAITGFGIITGGVWIVLQFFKNLGLTVANIALGIGMALNACAQNLMTAFHNAICHVQAWFWDLLATALEVIEGIAKKLNKLPFVDIDYSGISDAADDYAAKAAEATGNMESYLNIKDEFKKGMETFDTFQEGWMLDAFTEGADWGNDISDKVASVFKDEDKKDNGIGDIESMLEGIPDGVEDIADSTDDIADSLSISEENLKYMRDMAEREATNRFTTAEIKIEQTNHNKISSDMDIDGVVSGLTDAVNEAVDIIAEGVHK